MNDGAILQLVTFKLGTEEFGVDILKVQEINKMMNITKIPNAPTFIEGVINLRGKIIPIVDLANASASGTSRTINRRVLSWWNSMAWCSVLSLIPFQRC